MTATVPRPSSARPVLGKLRDRVFKVAELVTTPLLPADYLDLLDPLRSGAALRGRIEAVRPETRDAATIVIRPGRDWLPHTPGQYVRTGIDVGVVHSAPAADGVIFGAELRQLASDGRIRLVERHTDTEGLLDAAALAE